MAGRFGVTAFEDIRRVTENSRAIRSSGPATMLQVSHNSRAYDHRSYKHRSGSLPSLEQQQASAQVGGEDGRADQAGQHSLGGWFRGREQNALRPDGRERNVYQTE